MILSSPPDGSARTYRLRASRAPKGMAYPVRRCTLDAALAVAELDVLREVRFRNWPGRPLLEAIFFGVGRHTPHLGTCELEIGAVPAREARKVEALVLSEAMPSFLEWLRITQRASIAQPLNIFRWSAKLVNGEIVVSRMSG